MLELIAQASRRYQRAEGPITSHPELRQFAGFADTFPGGANRRWMGSAIVNHTFPAGRGRVSTDLHEVAHLWDYTCGDETGELCSNSAEFIRAWRSTVWRDDDKLWFRNRQEAFAECLARYLEGGSARAHMWEHYPWIYWYFRDHVRRWASLRY